MKRTISLLTVLAFIFALSGSVFAQSSTVSASADIVSTLSVSNQGDLSFGQLNNSQSTDAIIDPNGSNSNVGNTTSLGKVQITASNGASIDISFNNPAALNGPSSSTISFAGDYTGNESDDAGASTDLDEGATNSVTLGGSNDTYYVYLGGTLTGGEIDGATTGNYTNDITVNVSYQ